MNGTNEAKRNRAVIGVLLLFLAVTNLPAVGAEGKVNINTASTEELTRLPRVGTVVAKRIVEFREKNGKFKQSEDLLLVSGIGDRTFDLIEPYVSLEGETTLDSKVSSSTKSEG